MPCRSLGCNAVLRHCCDGSAPGGIQGRIQAAGNGKGYIQDECKGITADFSVCDGFAGGVSCTVCWQFKKGNLICDMTCVDWLQSSSRCGGQTPKTKRQEERNARGTHSWPQPADVTSCSVKSYMCNLDLTMLTH